MRDEFFESSNLAYVDKRCFNMAYMRHTGQWWEIRTGLNLEECLKEIKEEGILQPVSP